MRIIIILTGAATVAATASIAAETAHHWSYSGAGGPSHWGALEHDFAACGSGKSQSPIDIHTSEVRVEPLPALDFAYRATPLHIVNNGHTVQVNVDPGSYLRIGDERYELVQFHFHHPSEEHVDGHGFPMAAHFVHRNSKGQLAVVAVPVRSGSPNALLATIWAYMPRKEGEADPRSLTIDPSALLPKDRAYYSYSGSLTTPPCTEGVRWLELKSAAMATEAELAAFARLYPNDARPIQKANGRVVTASK